MTYKTQSGENAPGERHLRGLFIGMIFVCWTLGACALMFPAASPSPTAAPTITPAQDGWESIASGLERRAYLPNDSLLSQLEIVRIDPSQYTFRAHYTPGTAYSITDWRGTLAGAAAFVNANFFDVNHRILGLLVADSVIYGESYRDRGGTFLVQNGQPRVRSNIAEPYRGEPLEQAVQAFPMLMLNGQTAYNSGGAERVTRRTVIAQDTSGRILLMATPGFGLTLEALSAYLPTTDMQLVNALNLDGGGSTMMFYQRENGDPFILPSLDPVPSVLAVYPK